MTADIPTSDELQPAQSLPQSDGDGVILDPEDQEFVRWASTADNDELEPNDPSSLEHGLAALDPDCDADDNTFLEFDDARDLSSGPDEEDDDDDDQSDEDEDEDEEDDEDEELAARAADDEFDDDLSSKVSAGRPDALAGVDEDDNDEIPDVEEVLEPIADEDPPVFERPLPRRTSKTSPQDPIIDMGPGVQGAEEDIFGTETEEDLQNAANILSDSGILGLGGLDTRKRYGVASDRSKSQVASSLGDEEFDNELALDDDEDDDDDALGENPESDKEKDGLDSYVDTDAYDDDEEFALTSKSSFGRLWEFNEDSYITITEPGQPYMYEMDLDDQEDQEMSTVRRGKAGGWSGGLLSNSADDLPKGSKEWIARKSYELISQVDQVDMFRWTRHHMGPPPAIAALYPPDPPPPKRLPRTTLTFSTPEETTPFIGMDSSGQLSGNAEEEGVPKQKLPDGINYQHALDKSIKFPCQYKFKVEGSGENLEEMLAQDLEVVLGRQVPAGAFSVEPAGKYKRVVIMVDVQSALQVTEVYDALRNNPGVKFSFG
eukprot:GFKZ01013624.1.p1 GENE.GFKZ01013624.1~~GFKZ01013624.1.p1  ORF type:complete len:632 (-),score=125.25 GFKZ01013624.1:1497-3134(-)